MIIKALTKILFSLSMKKSNENMISLQISVQFGI